MRNAEEFRSIARDVLRGKWKIAVLVGLIATLLGAVDNMSPEVNVNIDASNVKVSLNLVDQMDESVDNLFAYFPYWKMTSATKFLRSIYVILWSLLFVIPGIIALYNYAMTDYILAENPEMSAGEAINRSKDMMNGNRWRLFCLKLSFIGWDILCTFTLGIGNLWLTPYKQASIAAFYREVSGTEKRRNEYDWNGYIEQSYKEL